MRDLLAMRRLSDDDDAAQDILTQDLFTASGTLLDGANADPNLSGSSTTLEGTPTHNGHLQHTELSLTTQMTEKEHVANHTPPAPQENDTLVISDPAECDDFIETIFRNIDNCMRDRIGGSSRCLTVDGNSALPIPGAGHRNSTQDDEGEFVEVTVVRRKRKPLNRNNVPRTQIRTSPPARNNAQRQPTRPTSGPSTSENAPQHQRHQSERGTFPQICKRTGQEVHFVFPVIAHLVCTEERCSATFVNKEWASEKRSLIRHLDEYHNIENLRQRNWCSYCHCSIPTRISEHECLKGAPYYIIQEDGQQYRNKCRQCNFSCPTKRGLQNHNRTHTREDAEMIQSLTYKLKERERERANRRANDNNSESNPDSQQASNVIDIQQSPPTRQRRSPTNSPASTQQEIQDQVLELEANDRIIADTQTLAPTEEAPENQPDIDEDKESPSHAFTEKLKEFMKAPGTWEQFLGILEEYITFAQSTVGIKTQTERTSEPKKPNPSDPRFIQRLYRRNRLIQGEQNNACQISAEELAEHFCKPPSVEPERDAFVHPSPATNPVDLRAFTPREVLGRLTAAENSAPGHDRLTSLPPGALAEREISCPWRRRPEGAPKFHQR